MRLRLAVVLVAAVLVCILGLLSTPLYAWEADLHYGLTLWLAAKAGFAISDARKIAEGDQELDDSNYLNAIGASFHIIALNDLGAAEAVGNNHFPNPAGVPNAPDKRRVVPDNTIAETSVLDAIKNFSHYERYEGLRKLGWSLHPLQDSWAHQGVPDIPFRPGPQIWPDRTWGHPADRGGWWRHDSDFTHKHLKDTLDTARATYDFLCRFLNEHRDLQSHPAARWVDLEPSIRDFARGATKLEKLHWCNSDAEVRYREYRDGFLEGISLPEGEGWVPNRYKNMAYRPPQDDLARSGRSGLDDAVEMFLKNWLVSNDIAGVMKSVDLDGIAKELSQFNTEVNPSDWARRFLTLWLVEDHGAVNELGHGLPSEPGYKELPISPGTPRLFTGSGAPARNKDPGTKFSMIRYESLREAIIVPGSEEPYWVVRTPTERLLAGDPHYVMFAFRRLPHDGLVFVFQKKGNDWVVSRMYWLIA
jgi:hypothetical protein